MTESPTTTPEAAAPAEPVASRRRPRIRTAVVIVHGMGEQLPLETLNRFAKTALPRTRTKADPEPRRRYFSRPARVTDSYEARRLLAYRQPFVGEPLVHGHTEFFEYHWSYLMTGNKLSDLLPTFARLMLRRPTNVPSGLRAGWWIVAVVILVLAAVAVGIVASGVVFEDLTLAGVLAALGLHAVVVTVLLKALTWTGNRITASFVDVVRYLDKSPRSYAVRRDIRHGMVELLEGLHDRERYDRIVVVAHSLGAYIAYDAITSLWPEMCALHGGPIKGDGTGESLAGLADLEDAAKAVGAHPVSHSDLDEQQRDELTAYRDAQFDLWRNLRLQGNPWLITDLITVGTPMYFADLLYTKNRMDFDRLVKNTELPLCPPRSGDQMVEADDKEVGERYGYNNRGRTVLRHGAPFAVVRWTNLYFPVENGLRGDWFGGPLRPLFGTGIVDRPILGNTPGRLNPIGLAHSRYFAYPDSLGPDDAATVIQETLGLTMDDELVDLVNAPHPLPETDPKPTRAAGS